MPFPSVSLLDSFQRANETPLNNGGKWKTVGGTGENSSPGRIVSEQWEPVSVFTAGKEDSAYWTVQQYVSPAVALEIHNTQGSERMLGLWCCLSNPTTSAKSGYRVRMVAETTSKTKYVLERVTESTATTLTELTKQVYAAGDLIGISVAEGKVRIWHKSGAGEWTELASVADATYTEGYVGVAGNGNLFAARNFEAGGTAAHTHELSATGTPKATLVKALAKALAAAQASHATLGRGKALSVGQGSSASLSHSISRTLPTIKPKPTATLTTATARTGPLTTTQGTTVVLSKRVSRHLAAPQGSSAERKGVIPAGSLGVISQGSLARLFYRTSGALEPGFPYPMPFFTGPGLIDSYQHGTPAWAPDAGGVNPITHVADRAGWSTAVFKPYAVFNAWDDAAPTLGHQDERFVLGGVIDTNYYQPAHTPAGAAYDAGKRKLEPIDLTFPVVGHAPAGAIVMVQFFNPTPPAMYEPEPERNPGAKLLGDIGQLAHDSEFGTGFRDSKGNRCELISQGDGIWLGVIFVGGVTVGEETTPGGPLAPGDTMTIKFIPGALAGTMTKVIPDDVGFPVRVEEVFRGEGKEEVLAEHTFNVPPGQGIIQAHDWATSKGAYPYGTTEEEPSSWAGGSKKDPLGVLGEEAPEPLPLYYKLVPNDVGFYCFASVFVGNLSFGLGGSAFTEKRESRVAGFGYPSWEPGVFYSAGELVERFGVVYRSKGSVNHDPSDPANAAFWEVPSVGELSLPVGESPTAEGGFGVLAATNWTTSGSGPAGGDYANLLDAASHGNHMVIDYRDFGEGGTYDTAGSAVGWLDITFLKVGVRPKNELTNGEVLTSEVVEPDETLGVGPKGGLGKVIVLTVSGEQVADAQNIHAPRVTDAADLYLYYNWMNDSQEDRNNGNSLTLLTGSAWAAFFESEVKRLYEAAPNGDVFTDEKKVPPLIAELRLTLTVASATPPKWKMWDEEGEDPFSLGLMLSTSLLDFGPATGDLYENGVLIGTGVPLSAADATKPGGVEFVLRESLPALPVSEWFYFREEPLTKEIGLTFPGREPFGILHILPIFGSHFNTLHLAYTAEFRLYFPPLIEKEEEEIRVEVDKEKEEEREEAEKEKREEQEKEHTKEKEEKESEEEREKGREEEREELPGGGEESPEVSVEGNNGSSARVPSNRVIGKTVPNPNLPEGEFGEGGGGEVGSTDPNIQADVYLEDLPEAWEALWSCLNPASHEGYRVQIESLGGGSFEVRLDKIKGEEVTRLGETTLAGVAEGFHAVSLTVAGGTLTLKYEGATIITAADATFASGRAGVEGQTDTFGSIANFTQGGVLRDDLKRHEDPLGAGWLRLPWAVNTGRCFSEAFGWVATLPGAGNVSGAYWM